MNRDRDIRSITVDNETGYIYTSRKGFGLTEEEKEETIAIPILRGNTAKVGVEYSTTKNLGDYNSVRIAVKVELPCQNNTREIEQAHADCSSLADNFLKQQLDKVLGR